MALLTQLYCVRLKRSYLSASVCSFLTATIVAPIYGTLWCAESAWHETCFFCFLKGHVQRLTHVNPASLQSLLESLFFSGSEFSTLILRCLVFHLLLHFSIVFLFLLLPFMPELICGEFSLQDPRTSLQSRTTDLWLPPFPLYPPVPSSTNSSLFLLSRRSTKPQEASPSPRLSFSVRTKTFTLSVSQAREDEHDSKEKVS